MYFVGEPGVIFVVEAGTTFKRLAINEMEEECMATPAIAQNSLLIRTASHLYRIGGASD